MDPKPRVLLRWKMGGKATKYSQAFAVVQLAGEGVVHELVRLIFLHLYASQLNISVRATQARIVSLSYQAGGQDRADVRWGERACGERGRRATSWRMLRKMSQTFLLWEFE